MSARGEGVQQPAGDGRRQKSRAKYANRARIGRFSCGPRQHAGHYIEPNLAARLDVRLDSLSREGQSESLKGFDRSIAANLSGSVDGVRAIGDGHQLGAILWPRGLRTEMGEIAS